MCCHATDKLKNNWIPKLEEVRIGKPTLLHMESLGFANILYNENRKITGLLDYEDCIGGDPYFEICWMKYYFEHDNTNQNYFNFDRFANGYNEINFENYKIELYKPFTFLDKLRWIAPESERAKRYREYLLSSL